MKYFYDCEFLEGGQHKRILGFKYGSTKPTIDLISIGMISEDNRKYYAISKDFNLKEAWNRWDGGYHELTSYEKYHQFPARKKYWLRENVLKPIFEELMERFNVESKESLSTSNYIGCIVNQKFSFRLLKYLLNRYGKTNKQIAFEILQFTLDPDKEFYNWWLGDTNGYYKALSNSKELKPEFYGYYSSYDHVTLCWLFGKMIDLPEGFPMYTIDLKQELDRKINNLTTMEITDIVYGKNYMKHDVFKYADEKYPEFNVTKLNSIKQSPMYPKQTNEHNALNDAEWNKKLYEFLESI